MPSPVVVVGAGLAGTSLARELRKLDPSIPIAVYAADRADAYAKPNLSNALAAGKSAADLVQAPAGVWAARLGVEVRPEVRVESIDPSRRILSTSAGEVPYGTLVLAVGASPIRLPFAGDGADRVRSVNSLSDYAAFRDDLRQARTVAVVGGGLVGCEFADDLRAGGFRVLVFDPAPRPLGALLPPGAGEWMRLRLEDAGIRFLAGTTLQEIHRDGASLRLVDSRGETHQVEAVLSAVGLRPNLDLARGAGLAVRRGIVVDRFLRTGDPHIHALGDCAEVEGLVLPFVQPLLQGARALARTLAGDPAEVRYPAMPVVVKTPSAPMVVCPPPQGVDGNWQEEERPDGIRSVFVDAAGAPVGFALGGEAGKEKGALASIVPALL